MYSRIPVSYTSVVLTCSGNSHAMDALVDVDGVLSGDHLVDG